MSEPDEQDGRRRTVREALQGHHWVAVIREYEDGALYVKTADGDKFRIVLTDEPEPPPPPDLRMGGDRVGEPMRGHKTVTGAVIPPRPDQPPPPPPVAGGKRVTFEFRKVTHVVPAAIVGTDEQGRTLIMCPAQCGEVATVHEDGRIMCPLDAEVTSYISDQLADYLDDTRE